MTDTDMLYMASLKKRNEILQAENAELKRLLKAAVDDLQDILYQTDSITVCFHCIHTSDICYGGSDCEHEAKWTHLDEALTLIGEEGDTP